MTVPSEPPPPPSRPTLLSDRVYIPRNTGPAAGRLGKRVNDEAGCLTPTRAIAKAGSP